VCIKKINAVIIKHLTAELTVLARLLPEKKEDRFILSGYRKCVAGIFPVISTQ
jgi:hypothetical protein